MDKRTIRARAQNEAKTARIVPVSLSANRRTEIMAELFEERAAIVEFDGKLPRWLAERAAEEIVWAEKVREELL